MNKLRRRLANERGSALIDAMFGVVITALTMTALVSVAVTTTDVVDATRDQATRLTVIQNIAHGKVGNPTAVLTTPVSANVNTGAGTTSVTTWREDKPGVAVIHVAVPKTGATGCTNPAALEATCLTTTVSVPIAEPGIQIVDANPSWKGTAVSGPTTAPATVSAGAVGTFQVPVGATEVRYVLNINATTASGPGSIDFMNGATKLESIQFDDTDNSYFYGSVFAPAGTTITVNFAPINGGTVKLSRFNVYKGA
ncbi:hypothetical protein [Leifsonia sp. Leaf264]|uniref:hypothetical protein n=1 Tax=Leifsonia sp. Leaf264 TaxID=1736314 RepID=UPI0007008F16|nr:hypothetical protein [Leifsonia sp. Leaf264]KQO98266.1 hypothetical protein ASF30_09400 [Leifsonia sp. Leaf264]